MDPTSLQTLGDKELYDFLVNCPKDFRENERIRKFQLKNGEYVHCVLWNYHFYITGTDIVKILIWRFQNAGRPIGAIKKFEEGVFSDLRNLKPGVDATLEGPRTEFLEFLYKNGCIRTQKKQKVFYWYSVPHDELFCDALERDLRRDSTIYPYNRYAPEPQQLRPAAAGGAQACPSSAGMLFGELPAKRAALRDIQDAKPMAMGEMFNIKDVLFGKDAKCEPKVDCYTQSPGAYKGYSKYEAQADYNSLYGEREKRVSEPRPSSFVVGGRKMSFDGEETPFESESSPAPKNAFERKLNFDDFDLSQFAFLKERCMEQFGTSAAPCEKKLFEEPGSDDARKGMDVRGEVRFIGSNDHK
ncbi:transcription factor STE12 [Pancytospora philotis]|nr:transcription factor STE12 [Pancytospora philotis]